MRFAIEQRTFVAAAARVGDDVAVTSTLYDVSARARLADIAPGPREYGLQSLELSWVRERLRDILGRDVRERVMACASSTTLRAIATASTCSRCSRRAPSSSASTAVWPPSQGKL